MPFFLITQIFLSTHTKFYLPNQFSGRNRFLIFNPVLIRWVFHSSIIRNIRQTNIKDHKQGDGGKHKRAPRTVHRGQYGRGKKGNQRRNKPHRNLFSQSCITVRTTNNAFPVCEALAQALGQRFGPLLFRQHTLGKGLEAYRTSFHNAFSCADFFILIVT